MYRKSAVVCVLVLLALSGWWCAGRCRAGYGKSGAPDAPRQSLELTVYPQDFAMVREVRRMELAKGSNRLRVAEVSKQLDPQSVLLRWHSDASNPPQIAAHSYDLGVSNPGGLLKRYLGKEVEVVRYGENGREAERQKGRLMVEDGGNFVVQTDEKFYLRPPGTIVAPANSDIVTIPQLSVQAESPAAQAASLEVVYLTRGLSWSADYVATLSRKSNSLDLECWATVTNRTGVDYPSATVSLIAGTPNRAAESVPEAEFRSKLYDAHVAYRPRPALPTPLMPTVTFPNIGGGPETFGELYAYHIKNPTTVVQEQMNRLLMLSGTNVPVRRDYSTHPPQLAGWESYYDEWGTPSQLKRGNVQVALTFFNKEKEGLGAPLPQGSIRIYEPDKSGSLRYAGAATIRNTPKDQKVNVTLARAFDVFTEHRIVKSQRVNKRTMRKRVELILHNEKPIAVDLRVVQGFSGGWKVISESHKHANLDASQAQWTVKAPANGKVTLNYSVDLRV